MFALRHCIVCIAVFFIGCLTTNNNSGSLKSKNSPVWIFDQTMKGKYKMAGVGISKTHLGGINKQKELATSRAIDEIAKQLGTEVMNYTKIDTSGDKDKLNTDIQSYSIQTVSGKPVVCILKEMWIDDETKDLYVWAVVDK
jgi:hypothetical protein